MKKVLLFALALLTAACEKPILDIEDSSMVSGSAADANVILRISQFELQPFSVDEGSATITSEEKVTFPNNKVTDTFYYYGDLVVSDSQQSYDLTLTRAVAMFRLVLTDEEMPSNVSKFKFYYVGGSSTFNPSSGYGCVNSKQTEVRTVSADFVSGTAFDIYTLPHTEEDVLTKLIVTALDANDNTVKERTFENVPVTRNQITRYTGSFFGSGGSGQQSDGTFRLTADPDWDSVNGYTF